MINALIKGIKQSRSCNQFELDQLVFEVDEIIKKNKELNRKLKSVRCKNSRLKAVSKRNHAQVVMYRRIIENLLDDQDKASAALAAAHDAAAKAAANYKKELEKQK